MNIRKVFTSLLLTTTLLTVSCAEPVQLLDFIGENTGLDISGTTVDFGWISGLSTNANYIENTPQYDAYLNRLNETEAKFNCTINRIKDLGDVSVKLMAGAHSADILISSMCSKDFYAITDFSSLIDISDAKYGGLDCLENAMIDGVPYGVIPIMWPGFAPSSSGLMAYNRDLFKENNITDLHEYYENGIWTWDTYQAEFIDPINIQDKNGEIIYLLQTDGTEVFTAALMSNHVEFVKNENGELTADPYSQAFQTTITWWQDLIAEYNDKILESSNCHTLEYYRSQKALTCSASPAHLVTGSIAYNDMASFESGVMPWPAGPDAEYGEWRQWSRGFYGFSIPITARVPEAAALIIDELSEPFEEFGGESGLYDYYFSNTFATETDAEIFIKTQVTPKFSYEVYEEMQKVRDIFSDVITTPSKSVTEAMGQAETIFTELIEEYMIPNYNAVYGNK